MNTMQRLRYSVRGEVFDYQILMYVLRSYKKPRDKITLLLKNRDIIQVKRGLYIFGEAYRKGLFSLEVVSGMLVQPSYISREYALQHYGLLPERVETLTCMTTRNKKVFETPIGRFEYIFIGEKKFGIGVISKQMGEEGGVLYATKEKALADWLATVPMIKDLQEFHHFLFTESRIDEKSLFPLDQALLKEIIAIYKNPNVNLLSTL